MWGTENCSEQICLQAVLNVHNLSLAWYCEQDRLSLNRVGYPYMETGEGWLSTLNVRSAWLILILHQKKIACGALHYDRVVAMIVARTWTSVMMMCRPTRRSARSWLSIFFSKTTPSLMRLGRMCFLTSIFISWQDCGSYHSFPPEFCLSRPRICFQKLTRIIPKKNRGPAPRTPSLSDCAPAPHSGGC